MSTPEEPDRICRAQGADEADCRSRTLFWKVALPWEVDRPSGASPAPSSSSTVTPSSIRRTPSSTSTPPTTPNAPPSDDYLSSANGPQQVASGRRGDHIPAVLGHDFHRGTADFACLVLAPLADPVPFNFPTVGSTQVWEFSLSLPPSLAMDESSLYTDSLGRRAPRDLSHVVRSLPPTFRQSRDASVEWVCEATLRLSDAPSASSPNPLSPIPRYRPPRRRPQPQPQPEQEERRPEPPTQEGHSTAVGEGGDERRPSDAPADSSQPEAGGQRYLGGLALTSGGTRSISSLATTTNATVLGGAMVDDQGFKLSKPPFLYVARATFPFMPSETHVRRHGRFNDLAEAADGVGRGFGGRLLSKPEAGGATMTVEDLPFDLIPPGEEPVVEEEERQLQATRPFEAETEAVVTALRVFDKQVSVSPALGQLLGPRIGTISSRLVFPLSLSSVGIPRSTPSVPLTLYLSHSGFALSGVIGSGVKGKGVVGGKVVIERVCIVLSCRIVTRGGAEPKPHIALTELRRQNVHLEEGQNVVPTQTASEAKARRRGGRGAGVTEEGTLPIRMRLQLQGAGEDGKSKPCLTLPPSFRTPNIELEVRPHFSEPFERRLTSTRSLAVRRHGQRLPAQTPPLLRRPLPAPTSRRR